MTRVEAVIEAIGYMGDIFELPRGCKTEAGEMGEWIVTRHFAVKGIALPRKLVSKWPAERETRFAEMLTQWQSEEHRVPVAKGKGREHDCDVYRCLKRRKTLIQSMYAPILEGLTVFRYDGPGYQAPPLVGFRDGEPIACIMPWGPPAR